MGKKTSQGCPLEIGQVAEIMYVLGKGVVPARISKEQGHLWTSRPKEAAEAVAAMLNLSPTEALLCLNSVSTLPFPVWKIIKLGTHKSAGALGKAVSRGSEISDGASDLMTKVTVAETRCEIELYCATVTEIGFPDGAKFADIRARLDDLGFANCPAEVGPQLRRQYRDQPPGGWVYVMMDPITDSDGFPKVFSVVRDACGLWLYSKYARPGDFWSGNYRWVFRRK